MITNKIKKSLKKRFPVLVFWYSTLRLKLKAYFISDEKFVITKFYNNFGKTPDLISPKRYNEHISKILLTPPTDLIMRCVDKHLVRDYVKMKVGEEILNKLIGVYYNVQELEKAWESLPEQFVLRATHGCGWNYICKNKETIDFKEVAHMFKCWFKSNFYYAQRELVYKELEPKIICERYLEDESGGLIDYKLNCFYGEPKFINIFVDRNSDAKLYTYDMNWNRLEANFTNDYIQDPNAKFAKPKLLDKLIEYSRVLSEDFDYVRVDFYIVEDHIYFGELTFTGGNGAFQFTEEEDLHFGKYFNK